MTIAKVNILPDSMGYTDLKKAFWGFIDWRVG